MLEGISLTLEGWKEAWVGFSPLFKGNCVRNREPKNQKTTQDQWYRLGKVKLGALATAESW